MRDFYRLSVPITSQTHFPSPTITITNNAPSKSSHDGFNARVLNRTPPTEAWRICWPVIAAFGAKLTNQFPRDCLLCHASVPAENFCSTFVSEAVAWSCSHRRKGIICSACDDDFLLQVSLQAQKCLMQGCDGDLSVRIDLVEEKMGTKSRAFKRYREMVAVECIVCCEWALKLKRGVTSECAHERNTCKSCLEDMISVAVNGRGWDKLKCPEQNCKKKLDFEDVRAAASRDVFMRYDDLISQQSFGQMQNYQQCNRPGQVCESGQIHEGGDNNPRMECIACGFVSCFSCSSAWHEGKTCLQARGLLPQDPETEDYKRKYCKKCPGAGCGIFTNKAGQCHEMDCLNKSCGVMWCWECKLIMDTSDDYASRALKQHTAACKAPVVLRKKGSSGYRSVQKPTAGGKYRVGWDQDKGFVGTGHEYD